MPESLTRWNFRGYSHTNGMLMGTLEGEATTSKEFMLTPNLPRFVRVGDKTSLAASISNMTGKPQFGTVTLIPVSYTHLDVYKRQPLTERDPGILPSFL